MVTEHIAPCNGIEARRAAPLVGDALQPAHHRPVHEGLVEAEAVATVGRVPGVNAFFRASVAERVSLFVDRAWDHFRSRHHRTTFEILLNDLGREEPRGADDWRARMADAWDEVWSRVFRDARLPRAKSRMLQRYAVATLSGLAATHVLAGDLDSVSTATDPVFGLAVPERVEGVPAELLTPRHTWPDRAAYDEKARELAAMFRANFEKYAGGVGEEVRAAGPPASA